MSYVYIVQSDSNKDFTPAKAFGTLKFLTGRSSFPDTAEFNLRDFALKLRAFLNAFNPREDYVLLVGSPLYIAMIGAMLGSFGYSSFKVLQYDREEKLYFPLEIPIGRKVMAHDVD